MAKSKPEPERFRDRLKQLRESRDLSRKQLADAAEMSEDSVRLYEKGDRSPTWDAVQRLAAALGVTTDTFRDR